MACLLQLLPNFLQYFKFISTGTLNDLHNQNYIATYDRSSRIHHDSAALLRIALRL